MLRMSGKQVWSPDLRSVLTLQWNSLSKASSAHHLLCTFGIPHMVFSTEQNWNILKTTFLTRTHLHTLQVEKWQWKESLIKWKKMGKLFVYYIRYSHAQGHNDSRTLLCKSHWETQGKSWCESWKACSHTDNTRTNMERKPKWLWTQQFW